MSLSCIKERSNECHSSTLFILSGLSWDLGLFPPGIFNARRTFSFQSFRKLLLTCFENKSLLTYVCTSTDFNCIMFPLTPNYLFHYYFRLERKKNSFIYLNCVRVVSRCWLTTFTKYYILYFVALCVLFEHQVFTWY